MVHAQMLRWAGIVGASLLFSPIIFLGMPYRCVYCILLISTFWIMEVVPIGVTSLLPIFLFPVLGISSAKEICQVYFKDSVVLFTSTMIMSLAVKETNLHRRIALKLLCKVGAKKNTMLLGFLVTTSFLSFFLSDTATTALMIPIALAISKSVLEASEVIEQNDKKADESIEKSIALDKLTSSQRGFVKFVKSPLPFYALVLASSHGSLIGGTAIITSTGPNIVLREILHTRYAEQEVTISFLQWITFAMPPVIFYILASYIVLMCSFMGLKQLLQLCSRSTQDELNTTKAIEKKIMVAYKELGDFTFAEKSILGWFLILMACWVFRSPGFIRGWGDYFPNGGKLLSDSVPAVLVVFLLFTWPRDPHSQDLSPILNWTIMQNKFSWSCVLLIGAGYAISDAVAKSGLSSLISLALIDVVGNLRSLFMLVILSVSVTFMTEFMSNVSTGSVVIPIALNIAESIHVHPLYLALPVTVSCSFAFMLPMATPPNAIVYDTRIISMIELMRTGIILNICCICITAINMSTWTYWLFNLGTFPLLKQHCNGTVPC